MKRVHPRATSALGGVPPDGAPRLNEVSCRVPSPYRECHWPKSAGLVPTKFDVNHQFLGRQTWVILCPDFADSADSLTFPRVSGVLEAALLWCVKHPALFASGKRCERMRNFRLSRMTAKACEIQFSSTLYRKCLHFHTRFSHKGSLSFVL